MARASSEMAVATRSMRSVSQVAARPIACGKTVARPARATPCSASFHQGKAGMPSRSTGAARSISNETFSSSVRRATRSEARCSSGRSGLRNAGPAGSSARAAHGAAKATVRNTGTRRGRRCMASSRSLPGTLPSRLVSRQREWKPRTDSRLDLASVLRAGRDTPPATATPSRSSPGACVRRREAPAGSPGCPAAARSGRGPGP